MPRGYRVRPSCAAAGSRLPSDPEHGSEWSLANGAAAGYGGRRSRLHPGFQRGGASHASRAGDGIIDALGTGCCRLSGARPARPQLQPGQHPATRSDRHTGRRRRGTGIRDPGPTPGQGEGGRAHALACCEPEDRPGLVLPGQPGKRARGFASLGVGPNHATYLLPWHEKCSRSESERANAQATQCRKRLLGAGHGRGFPGLAWTFSPPGASVPLARTGGPSVGPAELDWSRQPGVPKCKIGRTIAGPGLAGHCPDMSVIDPRSAELRSFLPLLNIDDPERIARSPRALPAFCDRP
jgi:hypothetical protein